LHPLHRFQHRWIKSLDATVFGDVLLGVPEHPLHDLFVCAQLIKIGGDPAAETVPAKPWANLSISIAFAALPLWNMAPVVESPMDARYSSSRLASLGITGTGRRLVRVFGRFTTPFQTERLTAIASPV
jgi:hypothetical protein